MIIEPAKISAAFDKYIEIYNTRKKWGIDHKCECWARGHAAFEHGSQQDFLWLYESLRAYWQVFRRAAGPCWSAEETLEHMKKLDQVYRQKRLSECGVDDVAGLWGVLDAMATIKPTTRGPSVVAVSKFLHFWNPRLFMIVDYEMVWLKVFRPRWWPRQEMLDLRKTVIERLPITGTDRVGESCDLASYLTILLWAGQIARDNPGVLDAFARCCGAYAEKPGLPVVEFQAAAIEWLLLGLAELPN